MTRENLEGKSNIKIQLSEDVTFLNKASIQKSFTEIPDNTSVIIDASKNRFIHHDVIEIIEDFRINASSRNIELEVLDLNENKSKERIQHYKLTEDR